MRRIPLQAEWLLLWLLPVAWMGFCFDAFRHWEPSKAYVNAIAYLFLGVIWLAVGSKLKTALRAGHARIWGRAAVYCVSAGLTGLVFFILFPNSWAFWFVFFPGIWVVSGITRDKAKEQGSPLAPEGRTDEAPPGEKGRALPTALLLIAGLISVLGYAAFSMSGPRGELGRLKVRATLGFEDAQLGLAWRYREGRGLPQDFSKAGLWFEKAAKSGSARAQYDLGLLHYYGLGDLRVSEADFGGPGTAGENQARRWFELAARQDYAPAITLLGLMAAQDEHDTKKAIELWERAVSLQDPWAKYLLGAAYLNLRASAPDTDVMAGSIATVSVHYAARQAESEKHLILALYWLEQARRDGVEPIGGLLQHVWATVPSESVEHVSTEVFRGLEEGIAP